MRKELRIGIYELRINSDEEGMSQIQQFVINQSPKPEKPLS